MADVPFLGCKISLISKSDIRYEGILYCVDPKESTISLSKVRSYGTETRGDPANYVPPKNDVYDVIIFRASDVKDLRVDAPKPPVLSDPAIISATGPDNPAIISARHTSNNTSDRINNGSPPTSSGPRRRDDGGSRPQRSNITSDGINNVSPPTSSGPRRRDDGGGRPQRMNNGGGGGRPQRMNTGGGGGGGGRPQRMNNGGYERHNNPNQRYNNSNNNVRDRRGPPAHRDDDSKSNMNRRRSGPMQGGRRGRSGDRIGAPRGPRKTAPVKFEGEYDFDEANKQFLELEGKLKSLKIKEGEKQENGEAREHASSKSPAAQSESGSGYDTSEDHKNGDSKDGAEPAEYYDRSKSFFDNISCEASERGQGKMGKPDWRKERQTNAETFGISANYRRGGYRGRSFGANGYRRR